MSQRIRDLKLGAYYAYRPSGDPMPGQKAQLLHSYETIEADKTLFWADIEFANGDQQTVDRKQLRGAWDQYCLNMYEHSDRLTANKAFQTWRDQLDTLASTTHPTKDFKAYVGSKNPFVKFAHPVELQIATLLDNCNIAWEYEPREFLFPNGKGFKPDFYLPDHNLYVETTLTCRHHASRKRRRLGYLAEYFPADRAIVWYGQNIYNLLNYPQTVDSVTAQLV